MFDISLVVPQTLEVGYFFTGPVLNLRARQHRIHQVVVLQKIHLLASE